MQKISQILSRLINVAIPSSGLGVTIHFIWQQEWTAAIVSSLVTLILALLTIGKNFVNHVLARIEQRSREDAESLGDWIYSQLRNAILQLWWRVTSNFQGKYYQNLVYALRDYRIQGLKTKGPFVLDLQKVFVPLRVAPESTDKVPSALLQTRNSNKSLEIWDFLATIPAQPAFRRLVILGSPGSGKTTLLEHLALIYAQNLQQRYHRRVPAFIPILIYLRTVVGAMDQAMDQEQLSLPSLIEHQDLIRSLNPPPQWFETRLQEGKCLVMLDGLDEIAEPNQRQQMSQWIEQQMRHYPKSCFMLTSRPYGYRSAPLEPATTLEVQPFTLMQMQTFIHNWYLQTEIMSRLGKDDPGVRAVAKQQAEDLINRIKGNSALAAMALNPLLLTMIATIHCYRGTLPGRRVELYGEICDVLLGRRQEAKGLPPDPLTAAQKQTVLQVLALKTMQRKKRRFKIVTACLLIRPTLQMMAGHDVDPEKFLKQIEYVSGLLVEQEQGVYEFAHKSFQEYLAAVQIKHWNQEVLLTRYIDNDWWEETIRLYAALGDASYIIQSALARNTVDTLILAYDCLQEALIVQPDVRQQLEATLAQGLQSDRPELFRLAVDVKLSRRCRQLIRVNDDTEIDPTYITCAEYQLFLDDMGRAGDDHRPIHWSTERFAPEDATKPIAGIRAKDAAAYCEWLTQWANALGDIYLEGNIPIFVGEFRFRLPVLFEIQAQSSVEPHMGCWCQDGDKHIIAGIDAAQWQIWRRNLIEPLQHAFSRSLNSRAILALTHSLNPFFEIDSNTLSVLDDTCDRALSHAHNYSQTFSLDPSLIQYFDQAASFEQDLNQACQLKLDFDCTRVLDLLSQLNSVFDYSQIYAYVRENRYTLSQICTYLGLIFAAWNLVSDTCDDMSKQRHAWREQWQKMSRQYAAKRDIVFNLYVFFVVLDQRRSHHMPAWEGIRMVRDRLRS